MPGQTYHPLPALIPPSVSLATAVELSAETSAWLAASPQGILPTSSMRRSSSMENITQKTEQEAKACSAEGGRGSKYTENCSKKDVPQALTHAWCAERKLTTSTIYERDHQSPIHGEQRHLGEGRRARRKYETNSEYAVTVKQMWHSTTVCTINIILRSL